MKRAIVYFSLTDNTKVVAERIATELDAKLIRIENEKRLPSTLFFQIMVCGCQATFGICPKIKGVPEDILQYDEIIIGTPIWASVAVPAFNTLLSDKSLCKKVTGVFTFSGGGDNDKCIAKLANKLDNLRHHVALADRKNSLAADNDNKVTAFIEEIISGER